MNTMSGCKILIRLALLAAMCGLGLLTPQVWAWQYTLEGDQASFHAIAVNFSFR